MSHVLDNDCLKGQIFPISVKTYQRLIEDGVFDSAKVELIDGLLFREDAKVKVAHSYRQSFVSNLAKPDRFNQVGNADPLQLAKSEPEPDLSIIEIPSKGVVPEKAQTAALVIEVAITSLMLDRAKGDEYAAANIPEYWIVRPQDQKIEIYRHPENGQYQNRQVFEATDTVRSTVFATFAFRLADHL